MLMLTFILTTICLHAHAIAFKGLFAYNIKIDLLYVYTFKNLFLHTLIHILI